jgi:hypothetical protein
MTLAWRRVAGRAALRPVAARRLRLRRLRVVVQTGPRVGRTPVALPVVTRRAMLRQRPGRLRWDGQAARRVAAQAALVAPAITVRAGRRAVAQAERVQA